MSKFSKRLLPAGRIIGYLVEHKPKIQTPKLKLRGQGYTRPVAGTSKKRRKMAKRSRRINRRKKK